MLNTEEFYEVGKALNGAKGWTVMKNKARVRVGVRRTFLAQHTRLYLVPTQNVHQQR